jgi:hypothetical protein
MNLRDIVAELNAARARITQLENELNTARAERSKQLLEEERQRRIDATVLALIASGCWTTETWAVFAEAERLEGWRSELLELRRNREEREGRGE